MQCICVQCVCMWCGVHPARVLLVGAGACVYLLWVYAVVCTVSSLVGLVVAVMGDELIDVLVVVRDDVLGEEPHLRHILEGKVGV